jgi:hypothetical protein
LTDSHGHRSLAPARARPAPRPTFYQRWFGLAVVGEDEDITFLGGSQLFLLALMKDDDPAPPPPWFHFGIPLTSAAAVRDFIERMQAAAVPIAKPLYEDPTFASFAAAIPTGTQSDCTGTRRCRIRAADASPTA